MTPWRRADPVGPMAAFAFIIVAIGVAFTAFITFALVKGVRWEVNPIAGSLVETPVQRTEGFLTGGIRKNAGPVLSEADFDALLASLQEKLAWAAASRP